jgi:predicted nucleic-acid-binding Zn-ribbon protein
MKKIALLVTFSLILFSCKKENDEIFPPNPDWLTAKISQMETPAQYSGTTVFAYKWDKNNYYFIQIPLSNCGMCEFYDYQGVKIVWTSDKIDDFQKNARMIKIVWQRDMV